MVIEEYMVGMCPKPNTMFGKEMTHAMDLLKVHGDEKIYKMGGKNIFNDFAIRNDHNYIGTSLV